MSKPDVSEHLQSACHQAIELLGEDVPEVDERLQALQAEIEHIYLLYDQILAVHLSITN